MTSRGPFRDGGESKRNKGRNLSMIVVLISTLVNFYINFTVE